MRTLLLLVLIVGLFAADANKPDTPDPQTFAKAIAERAQAIELPWFGLTETEAAAKAKEAGQPFRVIAIDGAHQKVTRDRVPGRINVEIWGGRLAYIFVEDRPAEVWGCRAIEHLPYLGLTEEAAKKEAGETPLRVASRDGEARMLTMDFNPDRINVSIVKGIVTAVSGG